MVCCLTEPASPLQIQRQTRRQEGRHEHGRTAAPRHPGPAVRYSGSRNMVLGIPGLFSSILNTWTPKVCKRIAQNHQTKAIMLHIFGLQAKLSLTPWLLPPKPVGLWLVEVWVHGLNCIMDLRFWFSGPI